MSQLQGILSTGTICSLYSVQCCSCSTPLGVLGLLMGTLAVSAMWCQLLVDAKLAGPCCQQDQCAGLATLRGWRCWGAFQDGHRGRAAIWRCRHLDWLYVHLCSGQLQSCVNERLLAVGTCTAADVIRVLWLFAWAFLCSSPVFLKSNTAGMFLDARCRWWCLHCICSSCSAHQ